MDLTLVFERKLQTPEWNDCLAVFKKLMDQEMVLVERLPKGSTKEVFIDLIFFYLIKFHGPGMCTTCSCKVYYH